MSIDAAYVESHIADATQTAQDMVARLGHLSHPQLAWKPDPKTWSVGQIIDHLRVTNGTYDKQFEQMIAGTWRKNFWARMPGLKGMFGNALKRATHPDTLKPGATRPVFEPTQADIPKDILGQYLAHHEKMLAFWGSMKNLDLDETIIISPAGSFVVYTLRDGLEILLQHERRHLRQALRLMDRKEFPQQ